MRLQTIAEAANPQVAEQVRKVKDQTRAMFTKAFGQKLTGDSVAAFNHVIDGATNTTVSLIDDHQWWDVLYQLLAPADPREMETMRHAACDAVEKQMKANPDAFNEGMLSGLGSILKKAAMFIIKATAAGVAIGAGLMGGGYGGYGGGYGNRAGVGQQQKQGKLQIGFLNAVLLEIFFNKFEQILNSLPVLPQQSQGQPTTTQPAPQSTTQAPAPAATPTPAPAAPASAPAAPASAPAAPASPKMTP